MRDLTRPVGVVVQLDISKPGHPHLILSHGERYLGIVTLSNTPAVADDELNFARQRVKRKLREVGIEL